MVDSPGAEPELRAENLFNVLEKKQWETIRGQVERGVKASVYSEDLQAQSFLQTMALGRSMPYQLFLDFFDRPALNNFAVFQMISTRYPEVEQTKLLKHLASRQTVLELLNIEPLLTSEAFRLPDVQLLLRTVLYHDRYYLLWCYPKISSTSRLPLGIVRSLALEYIA